MDRTTKKLVAGPPVCLFVCLFISSCSCAQLDSGNQDDTQDVGLCVNASGILNLNGNETGYLQCEDGAINRDKALIVEVSLYASSLDGCRESYKEDGCRQDVDCSERSYGRCVQNTDDIGPYCSCEYLCESDADCDSGEACVEPAATGLIQEWPVCVSAGCAEGGHCESGECGLSFGEAGGLIALECRDQTDECRTNQECEDRDAGDRCLPRGGEWVCAATIGD